MGAPSVFAFSRRRRWLRCGAAAAVATFIGHCAFVVSSSAFVAAGNRITSQAYPRRYLRGGDVEMGPRVVTRRAAQTTTAATVEDVIKHPRLPVWPAWFGIIYILLDLITGNPKLGAFLEDRFGGRVCPMIFRNAQKTDPFLLVAHHRHSFAAFDPFRYVFRLLMPEGFPAHPHRGFETVTYVLRGGLVHRDSYGVKKSYGPPPDSDGSGEQSAVQWMTAGCGLQHEEMWRTGGVLDSTDQELFQIWVNLPSRAKMTQPRMQMLGRVPTSEAAPIKTSTDAHEGPVDVVELGPVPCAEPMPGVTVRVISGSAAGIRSPIETYSQLAILHISLAPGARWSWPRPASWTCQVYMRKGEASVGATVIPVHHTAVLGVSYEEDSVEFVAEGEEADMLLLAGARLMERIEMTGNIVMNSEFELMQAQGDLQRGVFGPSWAHTLDDTDWREKVDSHWNQLGRSV